MSKSLTNRRPLIRLALNATEVALAIGVSVASVEQMVRERALPPPRKWHSRKLWLVTEVEAYLSEWPREGDIEVDTWADVVTPTAKPTSRSTVKIAHDSDDPLQRWYAQIGYDPTTMSHEDHQRLLRENEARWRASIPGTRLHKIEKDALLRFHEQHIEVGRLVSHRKFRLGWVTGERLEARGFIEIHRGETDRNDGYVLTQAGSDAAKELAGNSGK